MGGTLAFAIHDADVLNWDVDRTVVDRQGTGTDMHMIAIIAMVTATGALASALVSSRQRSALIPVRVKREDRRD